MKTVIVDLETYWSDTHSLTKMHPVEYVMHPETEIQSIAVKPLNEPAFVLFGDEVEQWAKDTDFSDTLLVGHNLSHFDSMLLAWRLGIQPKMWGCTLAMAREAGLAKTVGGSLNKVATSLNVGAKLDLVATGTKGRKLSEFTEFQIEAMRTYNKQDVDLCHGVFEKLIPRLSWRSLKLIDMTIRMLTEPKFEVNHQLLESTQLGLQARKTRTLLEVGATMFPDLAELLRPEQLEEKAREVLSSGAKFAAYLQAKGVPVPLKESPTTGKLIPALAKSDEGMQELLEHDDPDVAAATAARLSVKSTILETRIQTFQSVAKARGGRLPIALNYYGADNTGRWCLTGDHEVLTRMGWQPLDAWSGGEIAQWQSDGSMVWGAAVPNVFDYDGEMVVCDKQHVSFMATPDHKFPRVATSGAVALLPVNELMQSVRFTIPAAGIHQGELSLTDDEVTILCAAQADGSLNNSGFVFGFRRPEKIERLTGALDRMGVSYTRRGMDVDTAHTTYLTLHYTEFPDCLTYLTEGKRKSFSYELLEMTYASKLRFIAELAFWDGWTHHNNGATNYVTTSTHNADFVVALCAMAGIKVGVHTRLHKNAAHTTTHQLYIKKSKPVVDVRSNSLFPLPFSGKVYCPTTETGMFLVRHKGRVHVTGNSGGMKMNQQNLPRVDPDTFKPSDALRTCLQAPLGYKVVVADLTAIELRVNHTLWKVPSSMKAFKADPGGADLYVAFAGTLHTKPVASVTKAERQEGKVAQLGLGFGAGAPKFKLVAQALTGGKLKLSDEDAANIVNLWRRVYPEIVNGWRRGESALNHIASGRCGVPVDPWGLCHTAEGGISTPQGFIHYPGLRKELRSDGAWGEQWVYGHGSKKTHIYGAKCVENLVQHLAREVMADNLLTIAERYPVAHIVHDEAVLVVPEDQAEEALDFMLSVMRTPPVWWPELVTWAAGGIGYNYGSAK